MFYGGLVGSQSRECGVFREREAKKDGMKRDKVVVQEKLVVGYW